MSHQNCRHLLGSLSDFVDGELAEEVCAEIDRHLEECENCRIVVDSLRKTIYLYKVTSGSPSVPEEVRQRLYLSLDLEEFIERKANSEMGKA